MANATGKTIPDLQALFDQFNCGGSIMKMYEDGYDPINMGLQDRFIVTRVKGRAFWLLHRPGGYNNGSHYVHTAKIVGWTFPDDYILHLVDDLGRRYEIELIFPDLEPGLAKSWRRWRAYRRSRRKFFEIVDAQILEEHTEIANTWVGP